MDAYDIYGFWCLVISMGLVLLFSIVGLVYEGVRWINEHFRQGASDDRDC